MNKSENRGIKLSVLIPSYNDHQYIEQCISSVLKSHRNDFEIIISDDCSNPATLEVIDKFNDCRLTVLKSDIRQGAISNWKKCLKIAQGDWIHFLASDDYYSDGTVDNILDQLNDLHTVYLVAHNCFDDASGKITEIQCIPSKVDKIFEKKTTVDWSRLLSHFNHDELVLIIFPSSKSESLLRLSEYSVRSSFMYWVLAIFYKTKISFINNGSVMKRYNHISKRAQWGEVENNKTVLGLYFKSFLGDLYNSWTLAMYFNDVDMLAKLFIKNRSHGSIKGGLYGLTSKKRPYFWPGSLLNLFLSPLLIIAKRMKTQKNN